MWPNIFRIYYYIKCTVEIQLKITFSHIIFTVRTCAYKGQKTKMILWIFHYFNDEKRTDPMRLDNA